MATTTLGIVDATLSRTKPLYYLWVGRGARNNHPSVTSAQTDVAIEFGNALKCRVLFIPHKSNICQPDWIL